MPLEIIQIFGIKAVNRMVRIGGFEKRGVKMKVCLTMLLKTSIEKMSVSWLSTMLLKIS